MLKAKELIRTNVLLDKDVLRSIDEFARDLAEDRSTAIRQLIRKALEILRFSLIISLCALWFDIICHSRFHKNFDITVAEFIASEKRDVFFVLIL